MANPDTERAGIEYVMKLECEAHRQPEDVHLKGFPYDISSPPRKIEVKAFGRSARGAPTLTTLRYAEGGDFGRKPSSSTSGSLALAASRSTEVFGSRTI